MKGTVIHLLDLTPTPTVSQLVLWRGYAVRRVHQQQRSLTPRPTLPLALTPTLVLNLALSLSQSVSHMFAGSGMCGEGLCLDALRRVHQQQRTLARR